MGVQLAMTLGDVLVDTSPQTVDDLRDRPLGLSWTEPEEPLQSLSCKVQWMSHERYRDRTGERRHGYCPISGKRFGCADRVDPATGSLRRYCAGRVRRTAE